MQLQQVKELEKEKEEKKKKQLIEYLHVKTNSGKTK